MTHSSLCLPFIILSVLKIRIDLLLSPVCSVLSHTLKKQSKDSNENSFILLMKRNLYAFVLGQGADKAQGRGPGRGGQRLKNAVLLPGIGQMNS